MELRYESKVIGTLDNNVFTKKVKASKHLLYKADAWGIDLNAFNKHLKEAQIVITDIESNKTYRTQGSTYLAHGFTDNLGYGEQIFLPRKFFTVDPNKNQQTLL